MRLSYAKAVSKTRLKTEAGCCKLSLELATTVISMHLLTFGLKSIYGKKYKCECWLVSVNEEQGKQGIKGRSVRACVCAAILERDMAAEFPAS